MDTVPNLINGKLSCVSPRDSHRRADETKNNTKAVSIGRVKKGSQSSQMKYA